jgi:hypothetical protein
MLTRHDTVLSLTLPIVDNTNRQIVLGYMTVVAAATSLIDVTQSRDGLANTGIVLIVSPSRSENLFVCITVSITVPLPFRQWNAYYWHRSTRRDLLA